MQEKNFIKLQKFVLTANTDKSAVFLNSKGPLYAYICDAFQFIIS